MLKHRQPGHKNMHINFTSPKAEVYIMLYYVLEDICCLRQVLHHHIWWPFLFILIYDVDHSPSCGAKILKEIRKLSFAFDIFHFSYSSKIFIVTNWQISVFHSTLLSTIFHFLKRWYECEHSNYQNQILAIWVIKDNILWE